MEKINLRKYVCDRKGLSFTAVKKGFVVARHAHPGETLVCYPADGDIETSYVEKEGYVVLTRSDSVGKPFVDTKGHINSWMMKLQDFEKCYDTKAPTARTRIFRPIPIKRTFIPVDQDIYFDTNWGTQRIASGGFLNISDMGNIYGIAKKEFEWDYEVVV